MSQKNKYTNNMPAKVITDHAPRLPFWLRCQTASSLWTLGGDQPVIPRVAFIR